MQSERSSSRAGSFWRAVLSSALAAAFLNLGTSVLDHPRAFGDLAATALPLTVGFVVLTAVSLLLQATAGILGRGRAVAVGPLRFASAVVLVLGAAIAPPVEVALRDASSERAAVVWALALGLVLASAVASFALAERSFEARRIERGRRLALLGPLCSVALFGALWLFEYGGSGTRLGVQEKSEHRPVTRDLPPVILITVDTLRADRVLGPDHPVPTPAIDALAADSVVFENARAAAPWTKPSLATILTGLSPLVHGTTNRRVQLPEQVQTLAERLQQAGYHTGAVGLNAHLERAFHFDQGFDDYRFPARPDYGIALGAKLLERWRPSEFPALFPSTEAIADTAIEWVRAQRETPFFLWLHVLDPHWPYKPPEEWLAHPELEPRRWGEPEIVTDVQAGNVKLGERDRARVQELYAGEIRYVDANLARLIATLQELGLYQRALIVFASDHGEEFWEHGRYEHGHTLYDEVLRVPLFFKLPGTGARTRLPAPVTTEALTPTLLDVLGIPFEPAQLTSTSLQPFWTGSTASAGPLFSTGTYYYGEKQAVVFDGKKLVLELDTGRVELYDLVQDPAELHSLASARHEDLQHGLVLLEEWRERCGALRATLGIENASAIEPSAEVRHMLESLGYAGAAEQ